MESKTLKHFAKKINSAELWPSHPRLTLRILNLARDQTQKYCYQVELDFLFPRFKNVQLFCFQKTKQSCIV